MKSPGRAVRAARAAGRAFDLLVPRRCVGCGRAVESGRAPLCGLCAGRLPRVAPPRCPRCGATRPAPPCGECLEWPAALRAARAPFRMEGTSARLVHALKYRGWTGLADPMGRAMEGAARALAAGIDDPVLVPVPLSAARRRERGFNQAELLAGGLARATGWPVGLLLQRTGGRRRQARLGRRDRADNVSGAFRATEPGGAVGTPLLVDDVVTTGATAAACATALERAGSSPAGVVSFARALHALPDP